MTVVYQVINYVYQTNEKHLIEVIPSRRVFTNIDDAKLAMQKHIETLCDLGYERTKQENKVILKRVEKGKKVRYIESFEIILLTIESGKNGQQ